MYLKNLSLINFKNYESVQFEFDSKINCFVGNNGIGKTNALDAIYQLAFGKSYFNPISSQLIRHGEDFFVVDGTLLKNQQSDRLVCSFKKGQKKIIKKNAKAYEKIAEHIGYMPLVIISPADQNLILEGSETRRKFVDGVIAQSDKNYLNTLLRYQKTVSQRNALLKYFALNHTFEPDTLDIYDQQLQELGKVIYDKRVDFLNSFVPILKDSYQMISSGDEQIDLRYQSKMTEKDLMSLLEDNLQKDRALQYTSVGPHKDDLQLLINQHPIKKFGSQGQQKSYLIALKIAQFHFLKNTTKTTPILLLDDIFDKLDEERVAKLIDLVHQDRFGQIFISDTHQERTENLVKKTHKSYKIISL
ncbi:MAG: DNA replication/repair protein RecF [Flavobacteriaceae bacterium]|nr:DNA replication/repair protein RecF [Flavobacteriaceae bacterium]